MIVGMVGAEMVLMGLDVVGCFFENRSRVPSSHYLRILTQISSY